MRRQVLIGSGTALLVLGLAACPDLAPTSPSDVSTASVGSLVRRAGDGALTLHPRGFGRHSYAAWKAQEGRQDSEGDGDHALYFQKMVPTGVVAAGLAEIRGLGGILFSEITGLSWEHRLDGHCGAGAPRWTFAVREGGDRGFVHIGCAAALHTPTGPDEEGRQWMRDSYTGASIAAALASGQASLTNPDIDLDAATVDALFIIFDEGRDVGPGFVYLDNITVEAAGTAKIFTGPADNARR
jgi:hypothetical protein